MRYDIATGVKRVKTKPQKLLIGLTVPALATAIVLSSGTALAAGGYHLFGDAQIVSPGHNSPHAVQTRSSATVPPGYGGIDFDVSAGMTVSDLNNLSTDYMFTQGSCGGGSPRFQVNVTNGSISKNIFVYIGPPPNYIGCPPNVWLNTSNLVTPASLVDTSQLPGGAFYDPYAAAQTKYGGYSITGIQLVTDAFWFAGTQTVQMDNVMINDTTYTFDQPQSKNECKNGGWQNLQRADGSSFKSQGDCIQYVNTGR